MKRGRKKREKPLVEEPLVEVIVEPIKVEPKDPKTEEEIERQRRIEELRERGK